MKHAPQIPPEPHHERVVQAHLLGHPVDDRLIDLLLHHDLDRVAGKHLQQQEHDEDDGDDNGDRHEDPVNDILNHPSNSFLTIRGVPQRGGTPHNLKSRLFQFLKTV